MAVVNIEALLAPIPGENPAGEATPFAIRNDLEEKRREIDPEQFDANDPARPAEAKYADWPGIIETAQESLKETSKDLLVAARLTEALAKVHGFAGLADGLGLMKGIVTQCWDRCHPEISDGDLEVRGGPFNWLSDNIRGARFPNSVRSLPLVSGSGGSFSWRDWKNIQEGRGGTKEDFDRAVSGAEYEPCRQTLSDIERCIAEATASVDFLVERIGQEAPTLSDLKSAIADCHSLSKMIVAQKAPAGVEDTVATADGAAPAATRKAGTSREEIYTVLRRAADDLEKIEPHSPIPYLLRRAHELGSMKFPELIRTLLSDGGDLDSIRKQFGLKEPEES